MAKHVLLALTNAVDGEDEAFNRWYDDVHLPDVLKVKGVQAAQRYRLSDAQRMTETPYAYLAVYEIETDDIASSVEDLAYQADNIMHISEAMEPKRLAYVFTAIGERMTRDSE